MHNAKHSRLAVYLALLFAGVVGLNTWETIRHVRSVIERQEAVTAQLQRWRATYAALRPVEAQWTSQIQSVSEFKDLLSLYHALNIERTGLLSSADLIVVDSISRVTEGGTDIGAIAVTISSAGKQGVIVSAETYSALIHGLNELVNRRDVRIGSVMIGSDTGSKTPQAVITGLALILRDGGAK